MMVYSRKRLPEAVVNDCGVPPFAAPVLLKAGG
jgi:hypothetical protein